MRPITRNGCTQPGKTARLSALGSKALAAATLLGSDVDCDGARSFCTSVGNAGNGVQRIQPRSVFQHAIHPLPVRISGVGADFVEVNAERELAAELEAIPAHG